MFNFIKRQRCIGLDIGESNIKMAEVVKGKSGYELVNFGTAALPAGAMDGEFLRNPEAIIEAIGSLFQGYHGEIPKVATAISGQSVFIRHVNMPNMSNRETAEAVLYEADSYLPIPARDATIDFIKVRDVIEDGIKKQEIMIVAARNSIIQQVSQLITEAGLTPAVMDVEPLAVYRTLTELVNYGKQVEGCVAIVDIGSNTTNISFFDNKALRFNRTVPMGGERLTRALVDHYQMTEEEAEGTKKLINLDRSLDDSGLTVLLHQKTEIIIGVIDSLLTEVRRSIEFFKSRNRGQEVSRLYITGGTAQVKGLATFMEDNLNLPVSLLNPLDFIQVSPKLRVHQQEIEDAGASLAVVIGLALSEVR